MAGSSNDDAACAAGFGPGARGSAIASAASPRGHFHERGEIIFRQRETQASSDELLAKLTGLLAQAR